MSTISAVSSSGDAWANMKAQRSQMQAKMFAKVDTDSSGGIDKTELQSLMNDVAQKTGVTNSSSTDALFSKMDANGDGSLSADELGKGMKDILPQPSTLDFAQSRTEGGHSAQSPGGAPPPPPADSTSSSSSSTTFDPLDTNQDGTVSLAERLAGSTKTDPVAALMKAIDTDGDSKISSSESDAFMQKLTSQLNTLTQSTQNSGTSTSTASTSSHDNLDLAKLVQQAYEQIANDLSQQAKGSTLSAVA